MSLTPQTRKRLPKIKAGLLKGDNYTIIGEACGVTEKTIDRDVKAWLQSGDFEDWLKTQWIELHGRILAEDPTEAYRQTSRLVTKMITQRQEIRTEGNLNITGLNEGIDKLIKFSKEDETDAS